MKIKYYYILLLLGIFIFSCQENSNYKNTSNMLYEVNFDSHVRNNVKEIEMVDRDLKIIFNCGANLSQLITPSNQSMYYYEYRGDTIINQATDKRKSVYVLNKRGRVAEKYDFKKRKGIWESDYKETWSYNLGGEPSEKNIYSEANKKRGYYINKEKYKYYPNGKVEIYKYGKDVGSGIENGLLRLETRLSNSFGDWLTIEEVDEDGIPYRNSTFTYTYDGQGNWTELIYKEVNNYLDRTTVDTMYRKIIYYSPSECAK